MFERYNFILQPWESGSIFVVFCLNSCPFKWYQNYLELAYSVFFILVFFNFLNILRYLISFYTYPSNRNSQIKLFIWCQNIYLYIEVCEGRQNGKKNARYSSGVTRREVKFISNPYYFSISNIFFWTYLPPSLLL